MQNILVTKLYSGGISPSKKIGIEGSFQFAQSMDIQTDPTELRLLPKTTKVSGSEVTDLIKWIVSGNPYDSNKYFYSEGGKIYQESSGVWSTLRTVANSHGQGLEVFNDYLYYIQDTQVGRYGPLSGSPTFTDNWATGYQNTSTNKFAPIKAFKEGFVIGHGNLVAWYDNAVIPTNGTTAEQEALARLTLPKGLYVRCIETIDEFIVIGTTKGTDITSNELGYIFFWDGISTTFNFYTPCEAGSLNAIVNSNNRLFSIMGSLPTFYLNYRPYQKIQRLPKLKVNNYAEIYPGAITTWQNNVFIGVAANSDSSDIQQGIYQWGTQSERYPEVLNYSYPISTGNVADISIGAVKGLGNDLYISWKDGSDYGVDKVSNSGDAYSTGYLETLIFDDNKPYWDKKGLVIKATHLPLESGQSIQIGYKKNRGSYTLYTANTEVGSTQTRVNIDPSEARFDECEIKVILNTTTTSPVVTSLSMRYDNLEDESINY